ncbi:MAG: DUF1592 domain-containing protein [Gemmatimonadetes bacterium]|nr:DUF1592 domain-containing protein [Gemmatimonadota bacterium]
MNTLTAAVPGTLLVLVGLTAASSAARQDAGQSARQADFRPAATVFSHRHAVDTTTAESLTPVIMQYCVVCHNDVALTGNLSLQSFVVEEAVQHAETAEKMIRKLAAGMMPPPGAMRPSPDTLVLLRTTLETLLDEAAAANPNPGSRSFQRLNRAEYTRSIGALLALDIDAGDYLPLDTKSANFDNIADAQILSPTLMDAYFRAASEVSRLAVGDPNASASEATYRVSRWSSQRELVEGAPMGTRGGLSVVHNFPADGEYVFRVSFHHETTGALFGNGRGALHTADGAEQLELSVNGERIALLEVDRWMHTSDPNGVDMKTDPVFVRAGPQRVSAAFLQRFEGPLQDLISPHDWSLASTSIAGAYGFTSVPHLRDLVIHGPNNVTGVSDTPSRRKIFTCRPTSPGEEKPCAEAIVSRLGTQAYRRPLSDDNLADLMAFFEQGAEEGGFELGIRIALEAILASPYFVFRFEETPDGATPGSDYRISDLALASRLSYFLWASSPDEELLTLAGDGGLSDPSVIEHQVRRMLADPRAEALGPRFAGQWLRLQDLEKIHPDVRNHPDFHDQLKASMRRETELFFNSLVQEDRSVLDLYTADYTFVNERLARHYGIPDVTGEHFRRVQYPDETRRGLFGHGSILTLTSHASRTSPVLRGKWVMEVILGTPPPPPPPGVPDLEQTESSQGGQMLTTRQRMEMHRASPVCRSCHQFMDPIGLALDNFDATGKWRIKENGVALDTRGQFYDGTPLASPADLREALLALPDALIRNFTANLLAYGLGRRVEYYDMPAVRTIARDAAANDYRMSSFILGVVKSNAFQMSRMPATVEEDEQQQ